MRERKWVASPGWGREWEGSWEAAVGNYPGTGTSDYKTEMKLLNKETSNYETWLRWIMKMSSKVDIL